MINFLGKVLYMKGNVKIAPFLTQSNTCIVIIIENKDCEKTGLEEEGTGSKGEWMQES